MPSDFELEAPGRLHSDLSYGEEDLTDEDEISHTISTLDGSLENMTGFDSSKNSLTYIPNQN